MEFCLLRLNLQKIRILMLTWFGEKRNTWSFSGKPHIWIIFHPTHNQNSWVCWAKKKSVDKQTFSLFFVCKNKKTEPSFPHTLIANHNEKQIYTELQSLHVLSIFWIEITRLAYFSTRIVTRARDSWNVHAPKHRIFLLLPYAMIND